MTQEQEGGDGSTNNQAGRDVNVHHHHYGVTEARVREIAVELWQNNAPRLTAEANDTYDGRAMKMTTEIITKTVQVDPDLLERFNDPRAQVALLKAQQAYGETGDEELAAILSGLVVAQVAESARTRQEIVAREAIECAPRLAAQHLNALVVIVLLTRMSYRNAIDVDSLLDALDAQFRPYYDSIPNDQFEYTFMGATAAGIYLPGLGRDVYNQLFIAHPNAMYPPFSPNDLPTEWTVTEEAGVELGAMFWLQQADPIENSTVKLRPDAADIVLRSDPNAQPPLTEIQSKLREFIKDRSITQEHFVARLREKKPEMARFLDTVTSTMALHFQPSAVGLMLARHAVAVRSQRTAEEMDKMFAVRA
ncbi:hypothetical protein JF781_21845 [Mycobacterium sp. WUMAC-067]|uniref:LPO_1073/Vpar_1526 family protein n=1 Tax=unclassified Mycobacterium TaxID=2642494 RepID=UPI001CD984EE|nr:MULTISPECIES: LPO_1073/Vpar_1526 family protein [unclassified Mycobacterium]MCA2245002.1 hypothetical protein [Mycobacterium sp. WUMAC-067]MCA2317004.1 hypothetical protein [Mycobacterium sp. WUMAC-025]